MAKVNSMTENVVKPKIELGLSFIVSNLVHKIQKIYL